MAFFDNVPPVTVALRLHTLNGPPEGTLLVEGQIPAPVLAGRQLQVGAIPSGELRDNLLRPVGSFANFLPMIALQGIDADDETREAYSFVGDVFTLRGETLTADVVIAALPFDRLHRIAADASQAYADARERVAGFVSAPGLALGRTRSRPGASRRRSLGASKVATIQTIVSTLSTTTAPANTTPCSTIP